VAASKAKTPAELLKIEDIKPALLTAAGLSDKAAGHLQESDKREAVAGLIANFLEPAGPNFVEELVFRYLLIRGDTLGGEMRNVGGFIAQKKLTRAVIACLTLGRRTCRWLQSETRTWADMPVEDADIELHLCGLFWRTAKNEPRGGDFGERCESYRRRPDCFFDPLALLHLSGMSCDGSLLHGSSERLDVAELA
jgi:hypothetical protein